MRKRAKSYTSRKNQSGGEYSQASTNTMNRTNQSFGVGQRTNASRPNTTATQLCSPNLIDIDQLLKDAYQSDAPDILKEKNTKYTYYHSKYKQPLTPWKQSAGTWTRSSLTTSFSKDKRFAVPKSACLDNIELQIPSTMGTRGTSQGLGLRSDFHRSVVKRTQDLMQIEDYSTPQLDADESFYTKKRGGCSKQCSPKQDFSSDYIYRGQMGRSFGCSWKEYQKNGILGQDIQTTNDIPGAGSYSPDYQLLKKSLTYSIHQKLTPFNEIFDRQIPPVTFYSPILARTSKYAHPSPSRGKRIDLSKPLNYNPGSAHYNIKRFLD